MGDRSAKAVWVSGLWAAVLAGVVGACALAVQFFQSSPSAEGPEIGRPIARAQEPTAHTTAGEDVALSAAQDPCASAPWRASAEPPAEPELLRLLPALAALPQPCRDVMPAAWQWAVLQVACQMDGAGLSPQQVLPRREQLAPNLAPAAVDPTSLASSTLACVLRHLVQGGQNQAPLVARLLWARFQGHRHPWATQADHMEVARALVRAVGLADLEWWRLFWAALEEQVPQPVRLHVLSAIGAEFGREALVGFIGKAVQWEDMSTNKAWFALTTAGAALSAYMGATDFTPDLVFPASLRLRIAMLSALPAALRWPATREALPLGTPEMATQAYEALATVPRTPEGDVWRKSLLSRLWTHLGPEIALADLQGALGGGLRQADEDQSQRVEYAIVTLGMIERDGSLGAVGMQIQEALQRAFAASNLQHISNLVRALEHRLAGSDPEAVLFRGRLAALIGAERLAELPAETAGSLTR